MGYVSFREGNLPRIYGKFVGEYTIPQPQPFFSIKYFVGDMANFSSNIPVQKKGMHGDDIYL